MLEKMRESSRSGLTMIIFAIIMVVFAVSFGAPMDGCQAKSGPQYAATVNGFDIETDELGMVFNRWGGRRNQDAKQQATEQSKALKALIIVHLLADEAKKMGMAVSEEELKKYLLSPTRNAEFQALYGRRGKLDKTYYKNYIENQLRVSKPRYEKYKRTELMARKYMELVEMQLVALPVEVKSIDALRNTKAKLDYIKFNNKLIEDNLTITDAEIAAFVSSNKADVKAQYDKDKAKKYVTPAKYRLRRIYISLPADKATTPEAKKALEEKTKAAIKKFEDAKKRVEEKKEDFGKVASDVGTDFFGKKQKGLMDWSPKEYLPEEISKQIDGMKKGDIKEAKTKTSLILYKFEDKQDGKTTPLEKVEKDIAKTLLKDKKIKTVVETMIPRLQAQLKTSKSLKDALAAIKKAEKPVEAPTTPVPTEKKDDTKKDEVKTTPKKKSVWDAVTVSTTPFFTLEGQDMSALFGGRLPPGVSIGRGPWDQIPGIGKSSEVALDAFKTDVKTAKPKLYMVGKEKVFVQLVERTDGTTPIKGSKKTPEDLKKDKAESTMRIAAEIRSEKSNALIKGWQSLFLVPQETYGPWIEDLYKNAYKAKQISFSKKNKAAIQLQNTFDPIFDADKKGTDKTSTKKDAPKTEKKKGIEPAKKK